MWFKIEIESGNLGRETGGQIGALGEESSEF